MPEKNAPPLSNYLHGGSTPIPDPTVLTTQQLLREQAQLREILEARLRGLESLVDFLRSAVDKMPATVADNINQLNSLQREKFNTVETRLETGEKYRIEQKKDTKDAVDAALAAAKEAVKEQTSASERAIAKSETNTTKQIDQIGVLISTQNKAVDEKINDIKERLDRGEGHSTGVADGWGLLVGIVMAIAAVATVVVVLVKH